MPIAGIIRCVMYPSGHKVISCERAQEHMRRAIAADQRIQNIDTRIANQLRKWYQFKSDHDLLTPEERRLAGQIGLDVEGGTPTSKPNQVHHFATNKSKTYTQAFMDITNKYGLDLDGDWNKESLSHQGRHPNAYHDFVLDEMRRIDNIANGNKDVFLELYESEIKSVIRDNPEMLYSNYWKGLKE